MRFTTNAYPSEQRKDAWRFALRRLFIELLEVDDNVDDNVYGEMISVVTGTGICFQRITATGQTIRLDFDELAPCIWLVLPVDGAVTFVGAEVEMAAATGDIVYGAGTVRTRIAGAGAHCLLIAQVPLSLPGLRSRSPLPDDISNLVSDKGMGRIFSALLRSVADTLGDIGADRLGPVEMALPEFIAATLLDRASTRQLGGAAGARAALMERIFQTIEMRLGDPALDLRAVAAVHGISPRYLQKLFEAVGESFGHFLRSRRLERCRLDLRSPLHAQKSISDILFQWGFNDSASFSRAFRESYNISPREYRKLAIAPKSAVESKNKGGSVHSAGEWLP